LLDRAATINNDPLVRATAIIYATSLGLKDERLDLFLEVRQKIEPDKSLRDYIRDLADFTKHLALKLKSMNKGVQ